MTILLVENAAPALEQLRKRVSSLASDAQVLAFTGSLDALAAARQQTVDVAFLATELPELSGLDLGRYLKDMYPLVNLVFLADGAERALDALNLHASGYLNKPCKAADLEDQLDNLRFAAG